MSAPLHLDTSLHKAERLIHTLARRVVVVGVGQTCEMCGAVECEIGGLRELHLR